MTSPPVLSITQLTRLLKETVETVFPAVWVAGEISNCTRASSGHVYLTLKDEGSQLKSVIWRTTAQRLRFDLHDGLQVIAAGPLEVYEPRGYYQLVIRELVPQGIGALELAFRQLHDKLAAEGLFAEEHKRPLPRFPRRIALVTSPAGAAVRDMLQVITRRWTGADVIIVPVPVQGGEAAPQIAAALRMVHHIPDVDVVITGRGGGSLEDLWPFNEEVVARAIYDCPIPVISAVGHEIDVTIADLVADRRALTPSEAGELVVPSRAEIQAELNHLQQRLIRSLQQRATQARWQLEQLAQRRALQRPVDQIHDQATRLDELSLRLKRQMVQTVERSRSLLGTAAAQLTALSPLHVLARGYSVTRLAETGAVLRRADEVSAGTLVETILSEGRLLSRVESPELTADSIQ